MSGVAGDGSDRLRDVNHGGSAGCGVALRGHGFCKTETLGFSRPPGGLWDRANFAEQDAREIAKAARQEYADALREVLYNF